MASGFGRPIGNMSFESISILVLSLIESTSLLLIFSISEGSRFAITLIAQVAHFSCISFILESSFHVQTVIQASVNSFIFSDQSHSFTHKRLFGNLSLRALITLFGTSTDVLHLIE
jgi:hypothetical protein